MNYYCLWIGGRDFMLFGAVLDCYISNTNILLDLGVVDFAAIFGLDGEVF